MQGSFRTLAAHELARRASRGGLARLQAATEFLKYSFRRNVCFWLNGRVVFVLYYFVAQFTSCLYMCAFGNCVLLRSFTFGLHTFICGVAQACSSQSDPFNPCFPRK